MRTNSEITELVQAEALFAGPIPTGRCLSRREVDEAVSAEIRRRGGPRRCTAEVAAAFGERPVDAAARLRWALRQAAVH